MGIKKHAAKSFKTSGQKRTTLFSSKITSEKQPKLVKERKARSSKNYNQDFSGITKKD